ncbi:MAG: DinB family protein [Pirellulales bacterium]|nr:DinB family protein [Pirellulales bacterium]
MTISEVILPEFDLEMPRTRRILSCLPTDRFDHCVHDGLHTLGWNANHIVSCLGWTPMILEQPEFDAEPVGGPKYQVPSLTTVEEILAAFDVNAAKARAGIAQATDAVMAEPWSLKVAGQTLFTVSKGECLRTWVLNHLVHHRAILSVYLRMSGLEHKGPYDM